MVIRKKIPNPKIPTVQQVSRIKEPLLHPGFFSVSLGVFWSLGFGIWSLLSFAAHAQPAAAPPAQDPLISLMLAQPRIEIGAPVTAVAWFDPPVIAPGQLSFYRVTFNALEESIEWPNAITVPPHIEMRPGARGQIFQVTGPTMEPRTTFNYRARSTEAGEFTVPPFTVQVYGKTVTVPAARLQVVTPPSVPLATPQQLFLEVLTTKLFVGQPANVRILLPASAAGMVQGLTQVQLIGEGFIMDQGAARQKVEGSARGASNVITFIHETVLTPVAAGKLELFAQAFTMLPRPPASVLSNSVLTVSSGLPQFSLLESEPLNLSVRPLPKEGELPGFTGAIGTFSMEPLKLATNVLRVGDPLKLSVTIRAGTNFARLVAPPPPRVRDWQILSATSEGEPAQLLQAQGFAKFDYTLIPITEEAHATPPIPFSFFDPNRAAYVDLTIPSVPLTVLAGRAPVDASAVLQQEPASDEPNEEVTLSGLAPTSGRLAATLMPLQRQPWFPLLQLAPIAAFLGLWAWDRRRRYLEEHPEILLRRRARRALHREWRILRRAARSGDVPGFATAAVSALRVGSAPHFPAEPRALVGSDVLQLLTELEKSAPPDGRPAVVRRLFAATDSSRFAIAPAGVTNLLVLQPEIERVLEELDTKL